jgi:hypothetical protein
VAHVFRALVVRPGGQKLSVDLMRRADDCVAKFAQQKAATEKQQAHDQISAKYNQERSNVWKVRLAQIDFTTETRRHGEKQLLGEEHLNPMSDFTEPSRRNRGSAPCAD